MRLKQKYCLSTIGGQYCNTRRPPKVVTSSENQLRLWFISDSTVQHRGFQAFYKTLKDQGKLSSGSVQKLPETLNAFSEAINPSNRPGYIYQFFLHLNCFYETINQSERKKY